MNETNILSDMIGDISNENNIIDSVNDKNVISTNELINEENIRDKIKQHHKSNNFSPTKLHKSKNIYDKDKL